MGKYDTRVLRKWLGWTPETKTMRRWIGIAMLGVLVVSVTVWFATREVLPGKIGLATARRGGLYFEFGTEFSRYLRDCTGREVEVLGTEGSVENVELLRSGKVQLAILQAGTVDLECEHLHEVVALAPLYPDVVHVIVRRGSRIRSVRDLVGRSVIIGTEGSGMRASALNLLEHYGIRPADLKGNDGYFTDLLRDDSAIDAAIVTTGLRNRDLTRVMASGRFDLLEVDAEALAIRYPHFVPYTIPRGMYSENPPLPGAAEGVRTVATMALLAARRDASDLLVTGALACLYEQFPQNLLPTIINARDAAKWSAIPLHPAARAYHDPYAGLGLLAAFVSSLAAMKELLFALAAVLYLLWVRWRRIQEKEAQALLARRKKHLEELLDETEQIELALMECRDPGELNRHLNDVTHIKLRGLKAMTHEGIGVEHTYSIFLTQCADLMGKIQAKLLRLKAGN
jgi:TRAP transporter TAXI family solute receptor